MLIILLAPKLINRRMLRERETLELLGGSFHLDKCGTKSFS